MISYRDRAYCASKVKKHTCGREFTKQDAIDSEKWWGSKDYPVVWGYFCGEPKKGKNGMNNDELQKLFDEQNELMRTFVAVLGDVADNLNDNTEKIKLEAIKLREMVEKGKEDN